MSNLQRILAGRKKESSVWKYFETVHNANSKEARSRCTVIVGEKQCGSLIAGTNATNLKKHLDSHHPKAALDVDKCNAVRKTGKSQAKSDGYSPSDGMKIQSISACLSKRNNQWPKESNEYKTGMNALTDVFVSTGYPLTIINNHAFRTLLTTLDSKFTVPGINNALF